MDAIKHYVKSFLLWELLIGLKLTGSHFFAKNNCAVPRRNNT
jgi:hypothetical protein